jgi:ubiquinone/menaquinone biosynthesis C-methylase UbiE
MRQLGRIGLIIGFCILLAHLVRRWAGDPPLQRTSHKEAIEPPEIVERYSRFMALPPMRLLRSYLGHYAIAGAAPWRVLDVGCGPGWFPLELAGNAPDATVCGVDLSYPMLEKAVAHTQRSNHHERVHFTQGQGELLPFADDTFDLIVSTFALHHWQDPVTVLDELRRVAQPGARIVIFDIRRDMLAGLWALLRVGQVFSDGLRLCENGEPAASVAAAYTASEAQRLALQAGWERTHVRNGLGWIVLERQAEHDAPINTLPTVPQRGTSSTH